jgi:hypothetical protein
MYRTYSDSEKFGPLLKQALGPHAYHEGDTVLGLVDDGTGVVRAIISFTDYNTKAVNVHVWAGGVLPIQAREFFAYAFYYAFVICGVNWVMGMCYGNEKAVAFDVKLGFEVVTRLEDAHPGGDMVVVGMHKDSWQAQRWLQRCRRYEWCKLESRDASLQ